LIAPSFGVSGGVDWVTPLILLASEKFTLQAVLAVLAGVGARNSQPVTPPAGGAPIIVSYVHWTRAQCAKTDPIPCVPGVVVYIASSQPGPIGYRVTIAYRTTAGELATQCVFASGQENLDCVTGPPAGLIPWTFAYFDLRNIDPGDLTVLGVSGLPVQAQAPEVTAPRESL